MLTHFYQLNNRSWSSDCIAREAHTTFSLNFVSKMQVCNLACVSKSSLCPTCKPFRTGKINLFDISVRVVTLYSCIVFCCNEQILFLISHRYKLSIYSVHTMSIINSINDKLTFGDKRKPSNLLSLFLCFANLWLQSYIIIVFFIIVNIIIIIIIVVNTSLPKSSTSLFPYLLLMKLGSNISAEGANSYYFYIFSVTEDVNLHI